MIGSILIFFIISFFLKVLLSKDKDEIQYSSVLLMTFITAYFFIHLGTESLVTYLPIFICAQLMFVILTLAKKNNGKINSDDL